RIRAIGRDFEEDVFERTLPASLHAFGEFVGWTLCNQLALVENADLGCEFLYYREDVCREKERCLLGSQFGDGITNSAGGPGIESTGRLIKDGDVRPVHECLNQPDLLFHPLRVR